MASRYERIFLLENIQNKDNADVILVAGGLLYDHLDDKKLLQLKFKVVNDCICDVVSVRVHYVDAEGHEFSSEEYKYDDDQGDTYGTYTQGMEFGKDVLYIVDDRTVSFTAHIIHVYYEDDVDLDIQYQTPKSFFRPRIPDLQFRVKNFYGGEWFTLKDGEFCCDSFHRGNFSMVLRNSATGQETTFEFVPTKPTVLKIAYNKKTGLFDITTEDHSD